MSAFVLKSAALLATASAHVYGSEGHHWKMFNHFKKQHGKTYAHPKDESRRFQIFRSNMARAAALQQKSTTGASFGITKFSDLTAEEFKKRLGFKKDESKRKGLKKKAYKKKSKLFKKKLGDVDWRDFGGVTAVKDQGGCGSCWAFSAVEQVESAAMLATGMTTELSTEQVVDCDTSDFGCQGGDTISAYRYMMDAGGLESESDMPYVSGSWDTPQCAADPSKFQVRLTDYYLIADEASDEDTMMEVIQEEPISICVEADAWQLYSGGVLGRDVCGSDLNHCVQLVGIQVGQYWTARNSWGEDWGEQGHLRLSVGENTCGLAEEATLVEVEQTSYGLRNNEM